MRTSNPVIGIDVAKVSSCYAVLSPDTSIYLKPFYASNNKNGLDFILSEIEKVEKAFDSKPVIVLESTGHYSNRLVHFFIKHDFKVYLVNPLLSHSIKNSTVRKVKNDKVDALDLARLFFIMELKEQAPFDANFENLKILSRAYSYLLEQKVSAINQLSVVLEQALPCYSNIFSSIYTKTSLQVLARYPSAHSILSAPKEDLITIIRNTSKGSFDYANKKYELLLRCATDAEYIGVSFESYSTLVLTYVKHVMDLNDQINSINCKINDLSIHIPQIQLLCSIPGIGPHLSSSLASEIGCIDRFKNAKQLTAYCGIDPSVKQSGNFVGTKNHFTKRGSPYLRKALYMAAVISIRRHSNGNYVNKILYDYYNQKIQSKAKKQALGAVMNKIVRIIFSVLKNEHPFVLITPDEQIKMHKAHISVAA